MPLEEHDIGALLKVLTETAGQLSRMLDVNAKQGAPPASDGWMSRIEAAAYLRISPTSLAKMAVAGGGPNFCKPSRRVIYRRSDLDQWVANRRCRSTSDVAAVA